MVNLKSDIGGLTLLNPVMTASGTFGYGSEYAGLADLSQIGAIIVKGTSLNAREGNPYPRMAETPSGMLNAVGLQNKGVDYFVEHIYPEICSLPTKIIVNVSGASPADYSAVCERLEPLDKVAGVEINVSCPNVKQGGMAFGTTCEGVEEVTREARRKFSRTMIVKLSPNVTDIASIACAAEAAGADSVSLINTLLGMAVDVERRRPVLSTVTGGLSGPCVRPVAVRMVWQVAKAVGIPVIGLGGITSGRDALEFIMAGASAVQVGTYNFVDPSSASRIASEIEAFCERERIADIAELRGVI